MNFDLEHQAHIGEGELNTTLEKLESAQLVRRLLEPEHTFVFKHALVQESAYSFLLRQERKRLHLLVAESLEQMLGDTHDAYAADLAHHFYEADAWEQAYTYSQRAGQAAQRINAPREAIEHLTHAIDAASHLQSAPLGNLYRARGQAHEILGDFEQGRADYQAALDAACTAHDAQGEWQALLDLGFLWASRDYARSGEYFDKALSLARAMEDAALLGRSLNRVGNLYVNLEQPQQALAYHNEALEIFRSRNDLPGIAESLDLLALAFLELADGILAEQYYRQAITLFRQLNERRGLSSSLALLTQRAWTRWTDFTVLLPFQYKAVLVEGEEALSLAQEISWRSGEAFALLTISAIYRTQGDYGHALTQCHTAIELAREIGHQQWLSLGHGTLGWTWLDLLAFEEAQRELELASQLVESIESPLMTNFNIGGLAHVYLAQGDLKRAQSLLESMLTANPTVRAIVERHSLSSENFLTISQRICLVAFAELALARGDVGLAAHIVDQLISVTPNLTPDAVVPRLWQLRAGILMAGRRFAESERLLIAVQDFAREHNITPLLWRMHAALGQTYKLQSRSSDAEREFTAAHGIVQEIAVTIPDLSLRAQFIHRARTSNIDSP